MDDKGVPGASNERKKGVNEKTKMGLFLALPQTLMNIHARYDYTRSNPGCEWDDKKPPQAPRPFLHHRNKQIITESQTHPHKYECSNSGDHAALPCQCGMEEGLQYWWRLSGQHLYQNTAVKDKIKKDEQRKGQGKGKEIDSEERRKLEKSTGRDDNIDIEFMRISTVPLMSTFFAELDQHSPRMMELFRKKEESVIMVPSSEQSELPSLDSSDSQETVILSESPSAKRQRLDTEAKNHHLKEHLVKMGFEDRLPD
ncbi:hypothetical protein D9C73_006015 [Collichthys lucidus]|uniref:Uncharacterized protein n=1 Tax=Collichthys lucidus TaxID=240159 RepID=A0A4V6ANA3_COLLU|nr:hypothetical protein D9C73_006015 [Collichthys lucidus]